MTDRFCNKCGKETDASGRFCQWCGADNETVVIPQQPPKTEDRKKGEGNLGWVFGVIFLMCMIGLLGILYISQLPPSLTITNLTITEKYPAHSYMAWCGKAECRLMDYPSVVDENGAVYGVASQQLWGMLRINNTYQVHYYHDQSSTVSKTIDGAVVNGTTYLTYTFY
jgi:hypothetical protein